MVVFYSHQSQAQNENIFTLFLTLSKAKPKDYYNWVAHSLIDYGITGMYGQRRALIH